MGVRDTRRGTTTAAPGMTTLQIVPLIVFLVVTAFILGVLLPRYGSPSLDESLIPPPSAASSHDHEVHSTVTNSPANSSPEIIYSPRVAALIAAIRNATARAAGGRDVTFSREAKKQWHEQNPCRSRAELQPLYSLRKLVQDVAPNAQWRTVFEEYETLHRVCMENVGGDVVNYFANRDNSSSCQFFVGAIGPYAGLGNKMLGVVSGLLYAILTQRVYLIAAYTVVPSILCEPFEGSSWIFDPTKKVTPEYAPGKQQFWQYKNEFYQHVDSAMQSNKTTTTTTTTTSDAFYCLVVNDVVCHPGQRFFCDTEQVYFKRVPWLYLNGCFYFLPKLFSIPSFQPVLLELFPDKKALTHLLRSAMLPADDVWRRVDEIHSLYFRHADRRVGFQVRYRKGAVDFNATHQLMMDRVLQCALENHILPEAGAAPRNGTTTGNLTNPNQPLTTTNPRYQTAVFIASLFPALHDFLSERYIRSPPAMEDVAIVQVTRGKEQHFNNAEEDKEALTEMISLSLTDYLFVTPLSTFGGIAQAYGGLLPWFIDNRPTSELACARAQTIDACYQPTLPTYHCPYAPELDKQLVVGKVGFLKECLPVDRLNYYGIQLITT